MRRFVLGRALVLLLAVLAPLGASAKGKNKAAPKKAAKSAPAKSGPAKAAPKASGAVEGALGDADRPSPVPTAAPSSAPAPKGPQRIDFDDRLIEGQSNKSGAVYLYDRKDLQVDSMVKQPSTFRSEIAKGLIE